MARWTLNKSTTNLATAADWDTTTSISGLNSTTNITAIAAATPKYTATFTAPNTTNACTGVWVYFITNTTPATTYTCTLQENTVDTAAVVTFTPSSTIGATNYVGWAYFKFATPYVYTSTTAGYYRFKFSSTSANGQMAADTAGTAIAGLVTDNRTGAPASTDDLWIGASSLATKVTLTLSGTNAWGSNTSTSNVGRQQGHALVLGMWGKVLEDYTTTNATTIKGWVIIFAIGEYYRGTVANPIAVGQTSTLTFSMLASGQGGMYVISYGSYISQGAPKTYWKTMYVSGNGATGKFGSSAYFKGTTDAYSAVDHADFKPTGNFSVSAWVKTSSATGQGIAQSYSKNTAYAGFYMAVNTGGTVSLYSGKNTGTVLNTDYAVVTSTTVISDGAWHHVVGTWDGTKLHLYIDGTEEGTGTAWVNAPAYAATNYVRIGCYNGTGANSLFFVGTLDDVSYYSSALSGAEITTLATNELNTQATILAKSTAYYRFETGALTTDTKNGHTLTDIGDPFECGTLVVADTTGWAINDKVCILATSDSATNYAETEEKFIKTISGTSITLSDTAGGAEAGLVYKHTTAARVLHLTNNNTITSDNTTYYYVMTFPAQPLIAADYVDVDYTTIKYCGTAGVTANFGSRCRCDNSVFDDSNTYSVQLTSLVSQTHSNIVCINSGPISTSGMYVSAKGCTFNDIFCVKSRWTANYFTAAYSNTFNRCVTVSVGTATANAYGTYLTTCGNNTFNDCEWHATRGAATANYGCLFLASAVGTVFNNCLFGTKGAIKSFCNNVADGYQTATFNNCSWGTYTNFVSQYLNALAGSYVAIQSYNGTQQHYYYQPEGVIVSTGDSLADTTVHTSGTGMYALRQMGESTDAIVYSQDIFTGNIQNKEITFVVWCKINSANYYGGTTYTLPRMTITYDGDSVAYVQATNSTDWQRLALTITPLTTAGKVNIKMSALTDATSTDAYVYWDDRSVQLPVGVQVNPGLMDVWADGLPIEGLTTNITAKDVAAEVWDTTTSSHNTAGTFGKLMQSIKTLLFG